MGRRELEELRQLKKTQFIALNELTGLTEQLAQAVDRRDQVSVQMVLSMRQAPIMRLQEAEETLRSRLLTMPEETAARMCALLNGAGAEVPEEEPLCLQVAQNTRLLERITAVDKRISMHLGGGRRSFYNTYRDRPEPVK